MTPIGHVSPTPLLNLARAGNDAALGSLLDTYRNYLNLLAGVEIHRRLQGKVDPSDVVQETFLEAHRDFRRFRGASEGELVAWLRQILVRNLANTARRYVGTKARDVRLERELAVEVERSSHLLDCGLADREQSPSGMALRREQGVLLADVLSRLSEDYRTVIVLRHLEELRFPEIAQRMERTLDSVKKLWVRALSRLRVLMKESG